MFFVDQGLISAGNFLTGVILARALDTQSFGTFVLLTAVLYFAVNLQTALTVRPLVIEGAALEHDAFSRLLRTYVHIQTASLAVAALVLAAVASLWPPVREYALPLAVAGVLMQAQEICRRLLYTRARTGPALLNNIVNYDLQALVLAVGARLFGLSLSGALWVIAGTSLLAVLLGSWQLRDLASRVGEDLGQVVRRGLAIGSWAAGSTVLTALAYEAYPAVLQAFHGLTPTAGLGVIRQLLGPVNLLVRPIDSQYLPRAARALAREGESGLWRVMLRAALLSAPPYVGYLLALALVPGPLLGLIYGERYAGFADLVRVFAVAELLGLPLAVLSVAAGARRLQRLLFLANIWNGVVLLGAGLSLVGQFGLLGVAVSSAVASAGRIVIIGFGLTRLRSTP